MQKTITTITSWLNSYGQRQRWAILGGLCLLVLILWVVLLFNPLRHRLHALASERQLLKITVGTLSAAASEAKRLDGMPLNAELAKEITDFEQQLLGADTLFIHDNIVTTEAQQQAFLVALAKVSSHVHLKRLDHQGNQIVIELQGNFNACVDYLHYLDQLPWSFAIDTFNYQVSTYPNASITITLHPLTTASSFVNVTEQDVLDPTLPDKDYLDAITAEKLVDFPSFFGIIFSPDATKRFALLNDDAIQVGGRINGYEVTQIEENAVYLRYNGGEQRVPLTLDVRQNRKLK